MSKGVDQYEAAFRRDPTDADAFLALRQRYQTAGELEKLAALCERRADQLSEASRAADLLWQAAEIHRGKDDVVAELRVLNKAIQLDKSHRRTLDRLKAMAEQGDRGIDLLQLLSLEISALNEAGGDARRAARIEYQLGLVWENRFGRLDRAINHYRRAFKGDPTYGEAVEAGRRIYTALGQWQMVAQLYQVELANCGDPRRRADLLLAMAQLSRDKIGDLEAAAACFSEVCQLRPSDESLLETLGEVYASPGWPTPGGLDKASAIFMQIAQRRQGRSDRDGAIGYLRRALGADPDNEAAASRLERAYEETGRWEDLDRLYRQRLSVATEMQAAPILMRRAENLERRLGDSRTARECYEAVLPQEPIGGPASNRLKELYRSQGEHRRLLELTQRELESAKDRAARVRLMIEVATILREHLKDHEAAAEILHDVLELDPGNRKGLAAYEDYFRQKGDYRNLAELLRFAAQAGREASAPATEVCARLEELADVSEQKLGDLEGAIDAWQQIAELHPDIQRAEQVLKRLGTKRRMWLKTMRALEEELEAASSLNQRLQTLRRMADVYHDKEIDPLKAIVVLRELLDYNARDDHALRLIIDIYQREADAEGLVWALRLQLEGVMPKTERLAILRRIGELQLNQLERPRDALATYKELLQLKPDDVAAQNQLQKLLDDADDLEGLAQLLERKVATIRAPDQRLEALKELAQVIDERLEAPSRALSCWQQVLALAPDDDDATAALARLYRRTRQPAELMRMLQKQLVREREAAPATRAALLREIGEIADQELDDRETAINAYAELVETLPGSREAVEALARLYTQAGDHEALVEITGRQLELSHDPEEQVVLAFKQVDLLEQKLGDPTRSAALYERIIHEIAPGDIDAHRRLKALLLRQGEYARAAEIAEREYLLTPSDDSRRADRIELSLEVGDIWWEQVQDAQRAQVSYERVLELDPDHHKALQMLRRVYHRTQSYPQLMEIAPRLFAVTADDQERQVLLFELAEVCERKVCDPLRAFEWYRRADDLYPEGDTALEQLRRMAAEHDLWDELLTVYQSRRKRVVGSGQFLALTDEMATICHERLDDPAKAFELMREALTADPSGAQVLGRLEALADAGELHRDLLEVYEALQAREQDLERRDDLLRRRARVAEQKLRAPGQALADQLRRFALRGDQSPDVVGEIERLAETCGRWDAAVGVHQQRILVLQDDEQRLAILMHLAQLLENRAHDPRRAFHAYLTAFSIRPRPEFVNNAWRLAREISQLPPPAPSTPHATADGPSDAPAVIESSKPQREDQTIELTLSDAALMIEPRKKPRSDQTIDLTLSDIALVIEPTKKGREDRTLEITASQVIDVGKEALAGARFGPKSGTKSPPPTPEGSPWEALAAVYAGLDKPDQDTHVEHLLEIAKVWSDGAHDVDRAFRSLTDAALLAPEHPAVDARLRELGAQQQDLARVAQVYRQVIEHVADTATLLRLHLRSGHLALELGAVDEAEAHYSAALALQPDHQHAADCLADLYQRHERWPELVALFERQLEVLAEQLQLADRSARLLRLADLYEQRLVRPFDAADALARLVVDDPTNAAALGRLADLYESLAIWPKQIETLQQLLELTADASERVALLLRVARAYKDEIELPDLAIETYERVRELDPDNREALAALTSLYGSHDGGDRLVAALERRVELAPADGADASEQRALLVALARALEQRGDPQAASVHLQRARALGEPDADIEEGLARVLVAGGKADEAVQLLRDQVDRAAAKGGDAEQVAGLLVRLARLQRDKLANAVACREALDEALARCPGHREALVELAELAAAGEHWDTYTDLQLRLADGLEHAEEALRLLTTAAGRVGNAGARASAVKLLERALQVRPYELGLVDALIALTRDDLERQHGLLLHKHDLIDDPHDKAVILTTIGQLRDRAGAAAGEVADVLRQALELDPLHVPAIDALSALHLRQGNTTSAQRLLEQAIEQLEGTAAAREAGQLYYRLGEIFEQSERGEEGYRFLMQALRLQPKNLLLRLAVGLNRHKAHRWREALRHLSEALEHPDAQSHAVVAAQALVHAGECERRLRRPERSLPLLRAALALDPSNLDALKELASDAIDRGSLDEATELLRKVADGTESARERIKLLDTLAEIYLNQLDRPAGAADCYCEILELVVPAEGGDGLDEATCLELLPRIVPLLRDERRHPESARAAEAVALLLEQTDARRDYLLIAAAEHHQAGNDERAAACWRDALQLDPKSLGALDGLTASFESSQRPDDVVDLLETHLKPGPPPDPDQTELKARLYERLARAEQAGGREARAIDALEQRLKLSESVEARLELAALYQPRPDRAEAAVANHRVLARDVRQVASLRALARAAATTGAPYRAHCLREVLRALDAADAELDRQLSDFTAPELEADAPFSGEITDADRLSFLTLPGANALREVMTTLWSAAATLLPRDLADFSVSASDRVSPVDSSTLAAVYSATARALGVKQTVLFLRQDADDELQVVGMAPPAVIVSPAFAAQDSVSALRFRLARALELTQPANMLATAMARDEFSRLFTNILHAFHPRFHRPGALDQDGREAADVLRRQLPYQVARRLGELLREQPNAHFDSSAWRAAIAKSANRVALVLSGDLALALRLLRAESNDEELAQLPLIKALDRSDALFDLLSFAASDAYYICRVKLGLGESG